MAAGRGTIRRVEPGLITGRLVLRRVTPADVGNLLALDGDPEVMRYLEPRVKTRAQIETEVLPLSSAGCRGSATEGARALVRRAFTELGVREIVATTMTVNTRSRAVLERAGLRHARTVHLDWDEPLDGNSRGDVEYRLSREDWIARTP